MFQEPDTSQNTAPAELEAELFPSFQPPEPPPEPLRFSLAQLLIGTTIAAVLLALFRTMGIYGAVLSFGAALTFTLGIYPQLAARRKPQQALMFDFVWGIVMPVVCLVFDPFVFKEESTSPLDFAKPIESLLWFRLRDVAYLAYPVIAWQLAALALTLVIGRFRPPWAAVIAGTLFVGTCAAGTIGVMLLPLSTLGVFVVIGILGYTPLLTAFSYARRARETWRQATAKLSWKQAFIAAVLGAFLALAIPAGAGLGALAVRRQARSRHRSATAKSPPRLRKLTTLASSCVVRVRESHKRPRTSSR